MRRSLILLAILHVSLIFSAPFQLYPSIQPSSHPSKARYQFLPDPIDVVIPSTKKDLATLELCIKGIKKNCRVRRVIVVSSEKLTDSAEWFDEKDYPFSKYDVALQLFDNDVENANDYFDFSKSRLGWYYQQLLKFYAPFVIPDISSNVLILDSDTIFLNPVEFLNKSNAGLYNVGYVHVSNYMNHANLLTSGIIKKPFRGFSGVSHHMLFQKCVLDDLFNIVEIAHDKEFWKAFCHCVDPQDLHRSGASEYEIYYNFVFSRTNQVEIRKLMWQDIPTLDGMIKYQIRGFHYVSCHAWNRN